MSRRYIDFLPFRKRKIEEEHEIEIKMNGDVKLVREREIEECEGLAGFEEERGDEQDFSVLEDFGQGEDEGWEELEMGGFDESETEDDRAADSEIDEVEKINDFVSEPESIVAAAERVRGAGERSGVRGEVRSLDGMLMPKRQEMSRKVPVRRNSVDGMVIRKVENEMGLRRNGGKVTGSVDGMVRVNGKVASGAMERAAQSGEMSEWEQLQRQRLAEQKRAEEQRVREEERIKREREEMAERMQREKLLEMQRQREEEERTAEDQAIEAERLAEIRRLKLEKMKLEREKIRLQRVAMKPQFINTAVPKRPLSGGKAVVEEVEPQRERPVVEEKATEATKVMPNRGTIIVPAIQRQSGIKTTMTMVMTVVAGAIVGAAAYFLLLAK